MTEELKNIAIENGVFAVLFVSLFLYVLRENAKREFKYQEIIEKLSSIIEEKIGKIEIKIDDMRRDK